MSFVNECDSVLLRTCSAVFVNFSFDTESETVAVEASDELCVMDSVVVRSLVQERSLVCVARVNSEDMESVTEPLLGHDEDNVVE